MPEINKRRAADVVRELENANPTREAFERIKSVLNKTTPIHENKLKDDYNYQTQQNQKNTDFVPESYKTTTDTVAERQRADAILDKMRGRQPAQPTPQRQIPGDIQALIDQQEHLETKQEFEQLDPDDTKKLQRIKMLLSGQRL